MSANQIKSQEQEKKLDLAKRQFMHEAICSTATACNNIHHKSFDIEKARQQSENELIALKVDDSLQAMLASQMLTIHKLQQTSMVLINGLPFGESSQYYTNTAIKLSNTFIQQATLLAKLQGGIGQKIVVEHVDVHQGGQAIVGNIQGGMSNKDKI